MQLLWACNTLEAAADGSAESPHAPRTLGRSRVVVGAAPSPTGARAPGAAMNSSTSRRARSSPCWTGGDFMT